MRKDFGDSDLEAQFDLVWNALPQDVRDGLQAELRLVTDKYEECEVTGYIDQHPELDAVTYSDRGKIDIYLAPSLEESKDKAQFVIASALARIHLGNVPTLKSIELIHWNEEQHFDLAEDWGFSYGEGY